ncbi:hypothetical protein COCVIDRAFT_15872 [Bipolaris victoriae FI3]|uniref:Uncharacterized protein n=2 Tax=Bipolaris TaxID=33194 RepID=W6Y1T5_COCC2|nr:uncharacterized protein COCCADRAFT_27704 [Bipolaris zeicola 26-R-13]XP_014556705.1 hypothetical protein COCVIDRAFT_15872 [Bipolaris victoriae FI3]EUC31590.1 hypothetical protein COCCADRAFT_27704 [Bipolaris zeicola 26-R-13]
MAINGAVEEQQATWRHPGQWICACGLGSLGHAAKIGESGRQRLMCIVPVSRLPMLATTKTWRELLDCGWGSCWLGHDGEQSTRTDMLARHGCKPVAGCNKQSDAPPVGAYLQSVVWPNSATEAAPVPKDTAPWRMDDPKAELHVSRLSVTYARQDGLCRDWAPRRLPSSLFAMGLVGVHTGWAVGGKGRGQ